jgi:hypothetical protein
MLLQPLETSLLKDTIERAGWHVHPEFPGHGDGTGLRRMLKLAVTTLRANVVPPVLLDKSNCVSDLHVTVPPHGERRGNEVAQTEADLSKLSTHSLAHRRGPRSLESIVRRTRALIHDLRKRPQQSE